jgi:hypothetical protein
MSEALADAVAGLLAALDDNCTIPRCAHHRCRTWATGSPDWGPSVGESVCDEHVPPSARSVIGADGDVVDALHEVYAAMEPYGYRYDPKTGDLLEHDEDVSPTHLGSGI